MFEYVSKPLREALPEGSEMIVTDVAAPFLTPFKTVFFVALFIAMPVVLFQVWQFVAPGLYKREKRLAIPLMVSSIVLFYTGIAFAYFIVFRVMFGFFASVTPGGVAMTPDISAYLELRARHLPGLRPRVRGADRHRHADLERPRVGRRL